MIEIICPYCDNKIEVIKVVVQDSLSGQNIEVVDTTTRNDIVHIDQKTWYLMNAVEKSKYEYIVMLEESRSVIVRVK